MLSSHPPQGPSKTVFSAGELSFGEFRLPPGHARWRRVNWVDPDRALLAFPGSAVEISQAGADAVVADPLRVVVYSPGTEYRRAIVSPAGDQCTFIELGRELAADVAAQFAAPPDPANYRFPFTTASLSDANFKLLQRVRAHLLRGDVDAEGVREGLYRLIHDTVASGYAEQPSNDDRRRAATERVHADLAEAVRRLIGADPGARTGLDELAARLHTSPFHLSRTFRARTGRSIHRYRTDVRLRASLDRLLDGTPITEVALELGFASQAHLTDRLRQQLGVTPEAWRRALRRRELSRILEEDEARRD